MQAISDVLSELRPQTVLVVSSRILYGSGTHARLKKYLPNLKFYKDDKAQMAPQMVIQVESIHKLAKYDELGFFTQQYDLVILDECESLLKQFLSQTNTKNFISNAQVFNHILKTAGTIIWADAFMTDRTVMVIHDMCKEHGEQRKGRKAPFEKETAVYIRNNIVPEPRRAVQLPNKEELLQVLLKEHSKGKRCFLASGSKTFVEHFRTAVGKLSSEEEQQAAGSRQKPSEPSELGAGSETVFPSGMQLLAASGSRQASAAAEVALQDLLVVTGKLQTLQSTLPDHACQFFCSCFAWQACSLICQGSTQNL